MSFTVYIRNKNSCLPSIEDNHLNFFTCYSDFYYYDIWLLVMSIIHIIITIAIMITFIKSIKKDRLIEKYEDINGNNSIVLHRINN